MENYKIEIKKVEDDSLTKLLGLVFAVEEEKLFLATVINKKTNRIISGHYGATRQEAREKAAKWALNN